MTHSSDLIHHLIYEHHKYDNEALTPKALNKLKYLIQKKAKESNIDAEVPHFWYMYGIMTKQPEKGINSKSIAENTPAQIDYTQLVGIVNEVLDTYYERGIEGITDISYEDAPYEVQRNWRDLDKMLRTRRDDCRDFFEVNPSQNEIWDAIDAVYQNFPLDDFASIESELLTWYTCMTRELNRCKPSNSQLMRCNNIFWRLFSLQLAESHKQGISVGEICTVLDLSSLESARTDSRNALSRIEYSGLRANSRSKENDKVSIDRAADGVVTSVLGI
jgi:hypothetical protein